MLLLDSQACPLALPSVPTCSPSRPSQLPSVLQAQWRSSGCPAGPSQRSSGALLAVQSSGPKIPINRTSPHSFFSHSLKSTSSLKEGHHFSREIQEKFPHISNSHSGNHLMSNIHLGMNGFMRRIHLGMEFSHKRMIFFALVFMMNSYTPYIRDYSPIRIIFKLCTLN